MAPLKTALLTLALLASAPLVACHPDASEPGSAKAASPPMSSAASNTPTSPAPSNEAAAPQSHRIVQKDHRSVVNLHVGDTILAPDDPAFAWKIELENKSAFVHVKDADESYRITKPGALRIMVFGNPKACMNTDAACTISRRRWDVTLAVN
jgi:hypothetical protein